MSASMALLLLGLLIHLPVTEQPVIDLSKHISSFSGYSEGDSFPDLDLLEDSANNKIGNACLTGATPNDLQNLGIPDIDARLQKLLAAHVLVVKDNKYFLGIPVIIGDSRAELAAIVDKKAHAISPRVASMLSRIREASAGNDAIVFHLLWSRVMDEVWDQVWKLEGRQGKGSPAVDWLIYPSHPKAFGTNYWSQDVAVTWSDYTSCDSHIVLDSRLLLLKAAWGQKINTGNTSELQNVGLLDGAGHFRGFALHLGDPTDKALEQLRIEYAQLIAGAYDYQQLSSKWHVPSDQLWVILLHETAYSVFADLSAEGKLDIPSVLTGRGDLHDCRNAISLLLEKPITSTDELEDLFRKTGWRGDERVVTQARIILANDSNNADALLYLGLSLFELRKYQDALKTFQHLSEIPPDSGNSKQVIAHLWMGHLLDLEGQREKAIQQYRIVVESPQADSFMNYSGYHIGPTTLRAWATERIKTPYTRPPSW